MKIYRYLLVLVIALLLILVCFASCGEEKGSQTIVTTDKISDTVSLTTSGAEATTASAVTTSTVTENKYVELSINGVDISEYVIIYHRSPLSSRYNANKALFSGQAYDFDRICADRLSKYLYELTGVRLDVVSDSKAQSSEYEIVIGETQREVSMDLRVASLSPNEYKIGYSNGSIAINGGEYGVTWHSLDYLEAHINSLADKNKKVDIKDDFLLEGTHELISIACVGDSITYGVGVADVINHSYPAVLQRLLWKDCVVYNYGNGGKTMRTDLYSIYGTSDSYMATNEYTSCLSKAGSHDIVIIMLGTNDSERVLNNKNYHDGVWDEDDDLQFVNDGETLIESLRKKNSDLTFLLMNCPSYFGTGGSGALCVREAQEMLYEKMVEAEYDIHFFDMHKYTEGSESLFPDKLHPNEGGYIFLAKGILKELKKLDKLANLND